jgi:hypothetical protein
VLNVLVLGNSVPHMVVPARTSRQDGTFAEWLERLVPGTRVDNQSRWYELLDHGSWRFQRELRASMPDVVVVSYGAVECQPAVVPTWLSRHLMTWDQGLGPAARLYRRRLVPRVWPALRAWQRWAAGVAGTRTWRTPPRRFAASLHQLVQTARHDRAVVLVLDLAPFGPRMEHHLPGVAARRAVYQGVLAEVVASFADPDVRLVRVSSVAEELGVDAAVPDGLHLSPVAHRRVGELLAAELRVEERSRQELPCTTTRSGQSGSP